MSLGPFSLFLTNKNACNNSSSIGFIAKIPFILFLAPISAGLFLIPSAWLLLILPPATTVVAHSPSSDQFVSTIPTLFPPCVISARWFRTLPGLGNQTTSYGQTKTQNH